MRADYPGGVATFSSVTRQHILQAIAEHDTRGSEHFLGVYGFDQDGFDTQWSAQALLGARYTF